MKSLNRCLSLFLTLSLPAGALLAGTKTYHLEIGDPERREIERPIVIDAITDSRTGDALSPAELARRLEDRRIVFIGESHTDIEFHRAQLRVVQELVEAGRWVLLGLEMYPKAEQPHLDRWVTKSSSEEKFLEQSRWYENWGYHWQYYRDIFVFAREHGIPMFALNTPREVISAVRKKGFTDLTEEEAAQVPTDIDFDSDEHRLLFGTIFDDEDGGFHMGLTDEMLDGFFQAQCAWDATFARNSLEAIKPFLYDPKVVLVVLVGSGHIVYDLGIQRQLAQWSDLRVASVIPIPVADQEGERVDSVRASYADFVWGLPPSTDPLFPTLGISTRKADESGRRSVIDVQEDSVAERAGFVVGDLLMAMDGADLADGATLNRLMSEKRWGDKAVFTVVRGEETLDLTAELRRTESSAEPEESEESAVSTHPEMPPAGMPPKPRAGGDR